MDQELDAVHEQLELIDHQLAAVDKNMYRNEIMIEKITEDAFRVGSNLQGTNAKLKILLNRFRKPTKLCLDISVFLGLCILIGMFTFLLRSYFRL